MEIFLITLIVIGIAVFFMSVGVIFSDIRIKGSCGGVGKAFGDDCQTCECQETD